MNIFLCPIFTILAFGFGMAISAISFAVNTYFSKKRSFAMGFGMAGMGLGPVFMPLLISFFLGEYGVRGTMLIVGAISLHAMISVALLQPIKWHLKEIILEKEKDEEKKSMIDKIPERKNSAHTEGKFKLEILNLLSLIFKYLFIY